MSCADRPARQPFQRPKIVPARARAATRARHTRTRARAPARGTLAALVLTLSLALPGGAAARAFFSAEAPEALPPADDLAEAMAENTSVVARFGEAPVESGAEAYAARGEAALYVWWAVGPSADDPDQAIRAAFDSLHDAPALTAPDRASIAIDHWDERVEREVASLELVWRHVDDGTMTRKRALAFADGEGAPHLAVAECILHEESRDAYEAECKRALDSLEIASPAAEREEIADLGAPEGGPASTASDRDFEVDDLEAELLADGDGEEGSGAAGQKLAGAGAEGADPRRREDRNSAGGPRLDAPQQGVVYEQKEQTSRGDDGPPWLLLIGAIFVAAAVYTTVRGKRDEPPAGGEASDASADPDRPTDAVAEKTGGAAATAGADAKEPRADDDLEAEGSDATPPDAPGRGKAGGETR